MSSTESHTEVRGAYGLSLPDSPFQHLLNAGTTDWPQWRIEIADSGPEDPRPDQVFTDREALIHLAPSGYSMIDRASATSIVHQIPTPPDDAMIHPLLASTAVVHADWTGKLVFHGGSFLDAAGRTWGVVGSREAGKSSFLAWCATRGVPVVGDDLIVTDGVVVNAGPRCIDLRESAADRFGIGEDIGVVGTRRRWRHQTDPVPLTTPLAGFIVLEWSDDSSLSIEPVGVADRSAALAPHRGFIISQMFPIPWMKVVSKPMVVFRRPRDWSALDDSMDAVFDVVSKNLVRL